MKENDKRARIRDIVAGFVTDGSFEVSQMWVRCWHIIRATLVNGGHTLGLV